jgi:N-acetyl-anhydromuramyl-L-alanine amidase AmpD
LTASAPLTVELAAALGEAVARRLPAGETDPALLAQAASQALQQLQAAPHPATASPASGSPDAATTPSATALRQLVWLPEFAAFLAPPDALQPAGPPAANPRRQALIERCQHSFAPELLPPLLAFSDSCRAARMAPTSGGPLSLGGQLAGLALAIPLFFAIGWLGHRWLNRQANDLTAAPSTIEALRPAAPGATAVQPLPPAGQPGAAGAGLGAPQAPAAAGTAALACLRGGQSEVQAPADPSNYDPRESVDWKGQPVPSRPQMIVLHETVVDEAAALALFQRRNSDDAAQASYHVLIGRDGRLIRVVNDDQRAFGAGDSEFNGLSVQLRPKVPSSINNIALHVSLVSPADGADGEARSHSGYTPEQYRSLASQIAIWQNLYGIPSANIATHQEVDRSGTRRDPRSFDWQRLGRGLRQQLLACGGGAPATAGQAAASVTPGNSPAP